MKIRGFFSMGTGRMPANGRVRNTSAPASALSPCCEACRQGFTELGLREIVSFTGPRNVRSRAVMTRLGMTHDPSEDFDHPKLAEGDPLRRHVLYRLSAEHAPPAA